MHTLGNFHTISLSASCKLYINCVCLSFAYTLSFSLSPFFCTTVLLFRSLSKSPPIAWEGHCDAQFKCHICDGSDEYQKKCTSGKGIPQKCISGKVCDSVYDKLLKFCHFVVVLYRSHVDFLAHNALILAYANTARTYT